MGLALVQSRALVGLAALPTTVEVHLSTGLPSFTLVGLADVEVKEARERVRSAILNSGLEFPYDMRITVNLAPADLPKDSGRFDLPIALGILAASGQIDAKKLAGWEFAGELSLSGELRSVRGALATCAAIYNAGERVKLVLPPQSAKEAALVPDMQIYSAAHLIDVISNFSPQSGESKQSFDSENSSWHQVKTNIQTITPLYSDMSDVKGQAAARRALEIASAGGHGILLIGPPGTGKSMLAKRFAGLLPPMSTNQALQSAAIASLHGTFSPQNWGLRPTRAPHHSASAVALVGGGSPPRPGEISLSHEGVLFLDELPEFPRLALEALREPLENGYITISRAARSSEFPARFQLIAAMNPCPCGYLGSKVRHCRCTPDQVARYQGKLSGPLLDRIDLHVEVGHIDSEELLNAPAGEPTAPMRKRCIKAREIALQRQGKSNQMLEGVEIDKYAAAKDDARIFLQKAASKLGWSARATHRTLKVARTIADLENSPAVETNHIAQAIQYRRALLKN